MEPRRSLTLGLQKLCTRQKQPEDQLLPGACVAGATFAATGPGLHHKICHALGGAFDLPHAETHAVVLPRVLRFNPRVLRFNANSIPSKMARLEAALGTRDVVRELVTVWRSAGAPETPADLGMTTSLDSILRPVYIGVATRVLALTLSVSAWFGIRNVVDL
jgi:alcohol dehydrogenase class IV